MDVKHPNFGTPGKEPMNTGTGIAGTIHLRLESTLAGTSSM